MLALDSVRLGVNRSGVRALAVVVGVGDVESLIGFSEAIDGEACRYVWAIFGDSMTDHGSDVVCDEEVDWRPALLLRGVAGDFDGSFSRPGDLRFSAFEKLHFFVGWRGEG